MTLDELKLRTYGMALGTEMWRWRSPYIRCPKARKWPRDSPVSGGERGNLALGPVTWDHEDEWHGKRGVGVRLAQKGHKSQVPVTRIPYFSFVFNAGQVGEWLIPADCKSAAQSRYGGSNPPLSTTSPETNPPHRTQRLFRPTLRAGFLMPYNWNVRLARYWSARWGAVILAILPV